MYRSPTCESLNNGSGFPVPWVPSRSGELCEQAANAMVDVIDDRSDGLPRLARGIFELPVKVPLARVHGAGVPTAHGDDDVGLPGQLVGEWLGELPGRVEAPLFQ